MRKRITYSSRPNHAARSAHARGDRQFRSYDTSYIKPKKSKAPVVVAVILAAIVVVVGIFAALNFFGGSDSTLAQGETVEVVIPDGAGAREIGTLLQDNHVVSSANDFANRVTTLKVDSALKPGAYTFTGPLTLDGVIETLKAGPAMGASFTIPEGYTIEQTAARVAEAYPGKITKAAFVEQAGKASSYAADYPFVADAYNNSLEGFLFPKTYPVVNGATAESVVRQMLDQYKTETATLDYSYAKSKGLSQYDVLILASIIERETETDNKATIASVFYNRLAIDMPLQSDATTAYVIGEEPTPDDLKVEGPYNTYLNTGLPVGPICSPGLAALKAACHPEETSYYYFYVDNENGSKKYYFSETYDEHNDAIFS